MNGSNLLDQRWNVFKITKTSPVDLIQLAPHQDIDASRCWVGRRVWRPEWVIWRRIEAVMEVWSEKWQGINHVFYHEQRRAESCAWRECLREKEWDRERWWDIVQSNWEISRSLLNRELDSATLLKGSKKVKWAFLLQLWNTWRWSATLQRIEGEDWKWRIKFVRGEQCKGPAAVAAVHDAQQQFMLHHSRDFEKLQTIYLLQKNDTSLQRKGHVGGAVKHAR